jgi:Mg-chelatase subunit ChlD
MSKTREEQLKDFKKSNKERKQKLAEKYGFLTADSYKAHLETKIKVKKTTKKVENKGIFYVIDILDASGSMSGGKYNNSVSGIKEGIKDLTTRKDVKYSLVEFVQSNKLNKAVINQNPSEISLNLIPFSGSVGANTPLYYTVYEVISNLLVSKEDKVLIKVYTDGQNNAMTDYQSKAANLIKKVQKENFTVTFVATPSDLQQIMRDINIDESNTFATADTAEGFANSMKMSRGATMSYFASADKGEDVLVGFYKKQEKL